MHLRHFVTSHICVSYRYTIARIFVYTCIKLEVYRDEVRSYAHREKYLKTPQMFYKNGQISGHILRCSWHTARYEQA